MKGCGKDPCSNIAQCMTTVVDENGQYKMVYFIIKGYISKNSIYFTIYGGELGMNKDIENIAIKHVTSEITRYKKLVRNNLKVFCNNIQVL